MAGIVVFIIVYSYGFNMDDLLSHQLIVPISPPPLAPGQHLSYNSILSSEWDSGHAIYILPFMTTFVCVTLTHMYVSNYFQIRKNYLLCSAEVLRR